MSWDEAFTAVFNATYPGLCRYLECMLGRGGAAQEVAQESLLRLYRLGPGRVAPGEERFWVYRVASNLAINEIRRTDLRRRVLALLPGSKPRDPLELVERGEEQRRVAAELDRLPAHQRAALLLREQEGMRYDEIARVLGVSLGKVKVDIFRARDALRAALGGPDRQRAPRSAP
jgi:RNA polymerase sigma-70 factor (ECF subfamily)